MKQQHAAILVLFALGLVQGVATQYPEPFRVPEWLSWSLNRMRLDRLLVVSR